MTLSRATTRTGLDLARAKHALEAAGLDASLALTRVSSVTNEVWLSDDFAVRVNRRAGNRLRREAQLGPHLPAEVGYPEVVACGSGTGFGWLVTRRSAGNVLSRCWPTMSPAQRRHAVRQLAFMLQALHATPIPDGLGDVNEPDAPHLLHFGQNRDAVAPLLDALARAAKLPNVEPGVMHDLAAMVTACRARIEPFDARTLIHGDLTFENVLWDGDDVTALIDFEWARPAPRDLELDVLLRLFAYPFLHVADDYEAQTKAEAYEEVPSWLAEDYPQLFTARNHRDRLRLYAIAFEVRQLLLLPPAAPTHLLSTRHPLPRLLRLLTHRSYLDHAPL
ncbi:MAG TPA: phosphotransferase [Acidimicrobiales bacterium]|jgi:aminoglycoside phosphotransferase (APT) family kinase protein|nr:phosphotransferase [Acidimicrobiales bacterium]